MGVKVKNGSPWPEAVLMSFRLFVQETDEEGVQCGKTHYKQACLRSGCAGNQSALLWVRTFSVWINLPASEASFACSANWQKIGSSVAAPVNPTKPSETHGPADEPLTS